MGQPIIILVSLGDRVTFAVIVPALKQENSLKMNEYEKLNSQQIRSSKLLFPYELVELAKDYVDDIRAHAAHLIISATKIPVQLESNTSCLPRSILSALAFQ
ncbi:MAG: hypothetical protein EZS28_053820 [Streblomastix strix]|uniref:Uncharacterized protein n=1 Tax=Streblomastix strix TaxID=222440 RepID=A0A5J4R3C4_9EUKA|nr:MAG: hypothetical protein EZS28_053820 [Streblomastix strix]